MGYHRKRTHYVPSKPPDPEEEREVRKELEALKKVFGGQTRSEVPAGPERGLVVSTSRVLLDEER